MWKRSARVATEAAENRVALAQRRSLLEASLDALVIIGPDAKIADANATLETVTGRTRSELLGSDASRYFTDPAQARQLYRDVLSNGSVRDRQLELCHRDGHVTSVLCSASAYRDEAGAIMGVVAAARPIAAFFGDEKRAGFDPAMRRAARGIVVAADALALAVGTAGCVGWATGVAGLQRLVPGAPVPSPWLALQFIVAASAAWLLRAPDESIARAGSMSARSLFARMLAALLSATAVVELFTGRVGTDASSALAMLSLGLGLSTIDYTVSLGSHRYWPAHLFAFTTGMIAISGLLDSVLDVTPITSLGWPSAVGLLALAVGVVASRPNYGLGALLTSQSLGGIVARWLWPSAIAVPVLLAVAMRQADRAALLPSGAGLTVMILSMIAWLGMIAVWNSHRIERSDRLRQSMEDALRRREQELREAHRLARIGSWRWDVEAERATWSPELYRIVGLEPTEPPLAFDALARYQTEESAARFRQALDSARMNGTPFELELSLRRPDGSIRFATARGEADRDADGRVVLLRGTIEDITERKLAQIELARVHRAQQASSRCNQVLVRATDEATLLTQICDIIVEATNYRSCWVGQAQSEASDAVRVVARAGAEDGYLTGSLIAGAPGSPDVDAVRHCIRSGETVLIADIASDPRASAWRDHASAYGYCSVLVIPLVVDGKTFGVLAIHSSERAAFGSQEVSLLRELADDLAFGVTALRTREAHARAEAQIRSLNAELESRVQQRTAELRAANESKDQLLIRQQATSAELEGAREREADLGFRIQQTLLLDAPPADIPGLAVAAHTLPSQRVDGDFYAFVDHQDQVLDVIVGDVMGKGILAALIGAATKTHFLKALGDLAGACGPGALPRPKDIVMMAHAGVARHLIDLESFVTLCYARIDMRKRRLEFVDCGHTGIIILRGKTGQVSVLHGDNLPLGVRDGELYEQMSVPLEPGDTLLMFSDGITDARDPQGNVFGLERLERCVQEHGTLGPRDLIDAVSAAVQAFSPSARPSDDQTSVALHVETTRLPLFHSEIELRSDLRELGRTRDFVRNFCRGLPGSPLDDASIAELELATNEAASNIMKHAYAGNADQLIRLEGDAFQDRVSVRLRHVGTPFQPAEAPPPTFNGTRESGFGAYIIARSVDEVSYYRDASGRNCVVLFKNPTANSVRREAERWS